jgi:integrase/recombinase XerD
VDEAGIRRRVLIEKDNSGTRIQPIPEWAQSWFDMKTAKGLTIGSLARYSYDIKYLDLDLSKATVQEIRHRIAELSSRYSRGVVRHIAIAAKAILRELDRDEDAEKIPLPKHADPRVVVYSQDEIDKVLRACTTIRDRLLIEVLIEIGPRRGELFNMRLKDVQFDDKSPIIYLHGKTGTRRRRLYNSGPDLIAYLSVHPDRNNPEAPFWISKYGKQLKYAGYYKIVHRIGLRATQRNMFIHGFRHTAATRDVQKFTDREMMIRYGWNRAEMVGTYAHLSARDVDEKDLQLHGLGTRTCTKCHYIASPNAKYCENCGRALGG